MTALLAALSVLRRIPVTAWVALGLIACYLALQAAHTRHDARIDAAGYARALAKANDVQGFVWPAERAMWQRRVDSLARLTAKQDTVLVTRIRTVRELLTDTLHDTTVVYREAVRNACTALANDCDAFRRTALARAALTDSAMRADSLAMRALALGVVEAKASFARAVKYRGIERGVCAASLAFTVFVVAK